MAEANQSQPAVVLGVETQIGLALVRELGRAGIRVVAISHDPCAIGLASRYVWRSVLCSSPRSVELVETLNSLASELGACSLLTVSEGNLRWLNSIRQLLDARIGLAVPSSESLRRVLDKSSTLAAATEVGLTVPRTEEVHSLAELERLAHTESYPLVLKWSDANEVAPALKAAGLSLIKAEYAHDAAALMAIGRRYEAIGQWPLIQAYCPGQGLGQFFFMRGGQPVRFFQHLRVAEWPPEGGYSSVCDSLPPTAHAALMDKSVALLRALEWEGVAMVEYRHDPATGKSVLMEVNGRFWGSLPLAVAAGAGFALHAHHAALGHRPPELPRPRSNVRCRMIATELKRLHRLWLQPDLIVDPMYKKQPLRDTLRFVGDFLRPGVRYFVWSSDDPMPFWRDIRNSLTRNR